MSLALNPRSAAVRSAAPLLLAAAVLAGAANAPARAATAKPQGSLPQPPKPAQPARPMEQRYPPPLPILSRDERLPSGYQEMVRKLMHRGPGDTLGDAIFTLAEQSFHSGAFDEATGRYAEFAQRFPRNLRLNQALERVLLIRDGRDFDDGPIRIYARAEGMRAAGHPDSAEAALTAGLARYPGARLRYHFRFALAEIARDKGDHVAAIEQALAVADTSASSRLAPAALKLAGDETLAAGGPAQKASGYYQSLLERFPDSPLAPGVRAQLLLLRKKMQL